MKKITVENEITAENINNLTEEEVFDLLNGVISSLPTERRNPYLKLLKTVFDFRTIQSYKRNLKKDMMLYGYKFFQNPNKEDLIVGIKRKE